MAEIIGEKIIDLRITAPSYLVAETEFISMLRQAGLVPDRPRCEIKRITRDEFDFHFVGRVKPATEKAD